MLLFVGAVVVSTLVDPGPSPHPTTPSPTVEEAELVITDHLASVEVSERVIVYLNGRNVGELSIDQSLTDDQISVPVEVGNYEYRLEAYITYQDEDGIVRNASVTGRGQIYVSNRVTFQVAFDHSGGSLDCILQEVS